MRRIVFKARYIEPILSGVKCRTVRRASGRVPAPGDLVGLGCRYDRPPFAVARVVDVRPFDPDSVVDVSVYGHSDVGEWRAALAGMVGDGELVEVSFVVVERHG